MKRKKRQNKPKQNKRNPCTFLQLNKKAALIVKNRRHKVDGIKLKPWSPRPKRNENASLLGDTALPTGIQYTDHCFVTFIQLDL